MEEQSLALRAAEEWGEPFRPLCLALSGLAGVGKTELAYRLARELRTRHPDGVLYLNLDDLRLGGVVDLADALGILLASLGVGQEWWGSSLEARRKRYLTKTEGMRLVVIVDNARYESEVVSLLPATGSSVVIAASQGPLADIEAGAAVKIAVAPLDEHDAMELLRRATDDPRLAAEPEAALGLVRLCDGLPAALHVAARLIRRHPRRRASLLLDELAAGLREKGVSGVEKIWDAAYQALGPDAARLYRLLAGAPGPTFTADSAAATLGQGKDAADAALEDLEMAGLADFRHERMRLPDPLRLHAGRCARGHGDEGELAAGRQRIVSWYLRQAQRADALAAGSRLTLGLPVPPLPGSPDVRFADPAQASRWMESERQALNGCVAIAYAQGTDDQAWALCEPLFTNYLDFPHYSDAVDAFRTGLAAAQRAGYVPAVVRMRCQLARPFWEQGMFGEAEREMEGALSAARVLGDSGQERRLRASAIEFRGTMRAAMGQWRDAEADFDASLQIHTMIGNDYGVMLLTYRLGQAAAELGDLERSAGLLERAHALAARLGRERMTARTGFALAGVLRGLGQVMEPRELYLASLDSARARGSEYDQARILDALAELTGETGDAAAALRLSAAASALRLRNGAGA